MNVTNATEKGIKPASPPPLLDQADLCRIKKLLPYAWRQTVQESHKDLTLRQISESFYLRTRNATHARKVFTVVADYLASMGEPILAEKCRNRIHFCEIVENGPMDIEIEQALAS